MLLTYFGNAGAASQSVTTLKPLSVTLLEPHNHG